MKRRRRKRRKKERKKKKKKKKEKMWAEEEKREGEMENSGCKKEKDSDKCEIGTQNVQRRCCVDLDNDDQTNLASKTNKTPSSRRK
ncbi:hypothetical protein M8J76_011934 [Diaphorina citri]|nr:hypothetical protein M8J76_011934 [Diaphorina citri]KAI5734195.1 hypothetical protein M8J77_003690 [Diaphorina citri]